MAQLKTSPNDQSVLAFLETVTDEKKRQDSDTILEIMQTVTGELPRLWREGV